MKILLIFTAIFLLVATYLILRNEAVFKFRLKMLMTDTASYMKMPSYETMLFSFKRLKKKTG